ncbi:MAG: biopolymer transporter ExbD [bacterium]
MDFMPPKKGSRLIINVTSLIDVMFLLLIFIMVTSTFKNQPAINLVLPRSVSAEESPLTPAVLYLTSDGAVYLNDQALDDTSLPATLAQMQATTGEDRIILRADTEADHGDVVRLIDLVKESGFTRVSISARAPEGTERK